MRSPWTRLRAPSHQPVAFLAPSPEPRTAMASQPPKFAQGFAIEEPRGCLHSLILWFTRLLLPAAYAIQVGFALHYNWITFADIKPSTQRCTAALSVSIPATPCRATTNDSDLTREWDGQVRNYHTQPLMPALFFIGAASTIFVCFVLYKRSIFFEGSFRAKTDDATFSEFFEFVGVSRKPRVFQTIISLVSFVFWLQWMGMYLDYKDEHWLSVMNPHLSDHQFLALLTWFTCDSSRLDVILIGDSLIQGFVSSGILLALTHASQLRLRSTVLLFLDIVHNVVVLWALPVARYAPQSRPHNLFMISGVVRALRVVQGVPELAKLYGLLADNTAQAQPEAKQPSNMLARASRRMETMMFDPSSSYYLFAGQVALAIKIFFFLGAAALTVIAFEGWPCEYVIVDVYSPCDCSQELKTFPGALYFAFIALTTVGFGDISPRTHLGRFAVIALIVCGVYMAPGWIAQLQKQHTHYKKARALSRDLRSLVRKRNAAKGPAAPSASDSMSEIVPRRTISRPTLKRAGKSNESQLRFKTAQDVASETTENAILDDIPLLQEPQPQQQPKKTVRMAAPTITETDSSVKEVLSLLSAQKQQIEKQQAALEALTEAISKTKVPKLEVHDSLSRNPHNNQPNTKGSTDLMDFPFAQKVSQSTYAETNRSEASLSRSLTS